MMNIMKSIKIKNQLQTIMKMQTKQYENHEHNENQLNNLRETHIDLIKTKKIYVRLNKYENFSKINFYSIK